MAQKKISELTSTSKLNDDNIIPLVQDGVTKHIRYGDMKSPMVEDVKAKVETYVDNKLETRTNYKFTTMVDLGFVKKYYYSVRHFWNLLYTKIGSNGIVTFDWNDAKSAYVGPANGKYFNVAGGTLIYSCDGAPGAWRMFSAIYKSGFGDEIYSFQCSISSDTTDGKESWTITKLADHNHILDLRNTLISVDSKLNLVYQYPSNTEKIIGKWHDGRNIMRLVVKSDNDNFKISNKTYMQSSAYALNLSEYESKMGYILDAKLFLKDGISPINLEYSSQYGGFLKNGTQNLNTTKSTYDCVVIEYVAK